MTEHIEFMQRLALTLAPDTPDHPLPTEETLIQWVAGTLDEYDSMREEVTQLRSYVRMWASDECDDPEDHLQRHSAKGVAEGTCRRCGMSWPCPSNLVAVEFPTLDDLIEGKS